MRRKIGTTKRRKAAPKRKSTGRRRRRISGIGAIDVAGIGMKVAGLTVGAVAARELNTVAVKQFPSLSPLMSGLIQMGVGVALPMFVKGNKFVSDMGDGMIANGGMVLAVSTGVISGMGTTMTYRINGTPTTNRLSTVAGTTRVRLPGVAGTGNLSTVSGVRRSRNRCV